MKISDLIAKFFSEVCTAQPVSMQLYLDRSETVKSLRALRPENLLTDFLDHLIKYKDQLKNNECARLACIEFVSTYAGIEDVPCSLNEESTFEDCRFWIMKNTSVFIKKHSSKLVTKSKKVQLFG